MLCSTSCAVYCLLFLNIYHVRAGQAPLYLCLRAGCAAALQEGLLSSDAAVAAGEDGRPDEEGEDERAPLVLQLLLGSLDGQAPTVAHIISMAGTLLAATRVHLQH